MPKRKLDAAIQDQLARQVDQEEIENRKKTAKDNVANAAKKKKAEDLKELLTNVETTTAQTYENTRPRSRLSALIDPRRDITMDDAVECMFRGVFKLLASSSITKRNSAARATADEIRTAFTFRLMTALTAYQQENLEAYWKADSTCPFTIPLGRDAFNSINAHIDGSSTAHVDSKQISELERKLINLIMANSRSLVAPDNVWSFDELMLPHASLRDPLVAFLERKPHPLGIVAYLGATRLAFTKLPFVQFIEPVTSEQGISGPHAFQSFLAALKGILGQLPTNDVHIVVDALFPTNETINTASSLGFGYGVQIGFILFSRLV
jgi:hypothetical protein